MATRNNPRRQNEQPFKRTAIEFVNTSGFELAARDSKAQPIIRRTWKRNAGVRLSPVRAMGSLARLRAENEALRNQVVHLQVQWDILKTTLGALSTSVCSTDIV